MNLLKSVVSISGFTLLSRILGFVRDFVVAHTFGAGLVSDAFFVAFKLPNLFRRLFAEGAFSQAFVPLLSETLNQQGKDHTKILINRVCSVLVMILLVLVIIGIIFAPLLVWISAPGFCQGKSSTGFLSFFYGILDCGSSEKFNLTVALTRITFPYIMCMSLVALAAGILNTFNQFKLPAFTPVILNLAMITAALLAEKYFAQPIYALAWGVIAGGILQLVVQLPALYRLGLLPKLSFNFLILWRTPEVKKMIKLMLPAILGVSVAQISLIINTIFATFLENGSVSWLYYADRLMEFPTALLGVALGVVLLPSLSKAHAKGDSNEYSRLLDWGLRLALLLTLPCALALCLLAQPMICTLFMHGAFTAKDVAQTELALIAYSVGITGLIVVKILAPGFYAKQDVRTPVKFALISLFATQVMNIIFVYWLKHAGLALSIGLAASLNALLLFFALRKKGSYIPQAGWLGFIGKILLALDVMGVFLWFATGDVQDWLIFSTFEKTIRLSLLVAFGAFSYLASLWLLGFRFKDFRHNAIK